MPARSASALTGGGTRVLRERPWGRSGWVTTPTTWYRSPSSARSEGTANCGVPKKTIRITPGWQALPGPL